MAGPRPPDACESMSDAAPLVFHISSSSLPPRRRRNSEGKQVDRGGQPLPAICLFEMITLVSILYGPL